MQTLVESPFLVPFSEEFSLKKLPTKASKVPSKEKLETKLQELVLELGDLQRRLYANDQHAILLVFQAMDAAGKDSTIRALLTGVDPSGCQVTSFKAPSTEELEHDFLWRTTLRLPTKGIIGVFNRSYYEEVLVTRVHPEFLKNQHLPSRPNHQQFWKQRFESIRHHERHLYRNGTIILKFFLNVSKEEQKSRLLARINEHHKNWKFDVRDVEERQYWEQYQTAYQEALAATSRIEAPWYAIPADNKAYMRACIAEIVVQRLNNLDIQYPDALPEVQKRLAEIRQRLLEEEA